MSPKLAARLIHKSELPKYEEYMSKLHYLGESNSSLTKCLRYVIENEAGEWLALLDFGYAALKNSARESWIGWGRRERDNRLRYVLNNTRFLVLPWMKERYRFIASQALSLVIRRISGDWEHYNGHHILLLETFVDEQREGTCYRAANWHYVGETSGFGKSGNKYYEHGRRKKVFLYSLHKKVKQILSETEFPHPLLRKETKAMVNLNKIDLEGLEAMLKEIPDPRVQSHYPLSKILLLTVCAFLSGKDSFQAVGEYAQNLPHDARKKLGLRVWKMPNESCIRKVLNKLDVNIFYQKVFEWLKLQGIKIPAKCIAIDGKSMRASSNEHGDAPHILSALIHGTGVVIAQKEVNTKTNEIPELKALLRNIDLKKTIVTADAMHTQIETANLILENGGDYVLPVKDNQFTLALDIERLHERLFSPSVSNSRKSSWKNRNKRDKSSSRSLQDTFPWSKAGN